MAGRKLGSKAEEEVVWMENVLMQLAHLHKKVEEYAAAKKGADSLLQPITRQLANIRQQGMMKNLGPLADAAGMLGVAAGRGSQMQRTRVLREGLVSFKQLLERVMKATIDADQREQHRKELEMNEARAQEKATKQAAAGSAPPPAPPAP
jgi:hypothetical protein